MAGNQDFLEQGRAMARTEGANLRLTLIGLERIDRIFADALPRLPEGIQPEAPRPLRFSAEYMEDLNRGYQRGLRSARITDSDWDVTHCVPEEKRR